MNKMKKKLIVKLKILANNSTFIHEKSRQFQRGFNNFNKLWIKEMTVRINPETE